MMKKIFLTMSVLLGAVAVCPVMSQHVTLDEAKQMTLVNNYTIRQSRQDVAKAQEIRKEAFTKYFPEVSATGFAMKSGDYFLKGSLPEMNLPVYEGNAVNLNNATQFAYFPGAEINLVDYLNNGRIVLMQPVFAGGQIRNGNKLARIGSEIVAEQNKLVERDQLLVTENYYWTLASLLAQRETVAAYKLLLQSLRRDVVVSYENGLVQKSDLLKIDLKINEVAVTELSLENGISAIQMALCQQIGADFGTELIPADTSVVILPPDVSFVVPDTAVARRPEYRMLLKAVDVSDVLKKIEVGKHLPTLAAGAAGIVVDAMDHTATHGVVMATLSVPVSDWWGGSHRIKQKSVEAEKSRSALADNSEKLKIQVQTAYNTLHEMWSRVALASVACSEAGEHLKVVGDNHRAGVVGLSDLLEAQAMWQQARQKKTEASYNYQIEMARYRSLTVMSFY